jgi:hypothetical protein
MEWVEYLVRLRFHVDGFYAEKLTREYVEREVRRKLSITEFEESGLMEIIISKVGVDGLLNIPVKRGEIWIKELEDGRFAINLDNPDDPKFTCAEVQMVREDLEEETIKAKGVKYVILGDIPDMGKARLVRVGKGVREVEEE